MSLLKSETLKIAQEADIVTVRQTVRSWATEAGLNLVAQTKIVTAASELARNTLIYGGGGTVCLELVDDVAHRGVRLTFEDHGPGIADIEQALKDGYTSGSGMGMGLGGSRRLASEFSIKSTVGQGTQVMIAQWK